MNPLDAVMQFFFQNIFFFLFMGFAAFFLITYLKFGKKIKYKIIDREEVERLKFIEAMLFNRSSKYQALYQGDLLQLGIINNGGGLLNLNNVLPMGKKIWRKLHKVGNIEHYLEFEQVPIKLVQDGQGKITYEELKNEKPMRLIAMVIKRTLFWRIPNPMAKAQAMFIENDNELMEKDEKGGRIIVPEQLGYDKYMGFHYIIAENTKPKLRNILDARVLVTDFNIQASRYFAKSQEQCVYSPELAFQMAQKQTELQIELAKKRGISSTT